MNRPIHFEIHAENPVAAAAFYTSVFGWKIEKWAETDYWIVVTGDKAEPGISGGMLKRKGSAPLEGAAVNAYVCTIEVASLADTREKILQAGGVEALQKMPVPGLGWLAYYKDPDGNLFGALENDPGAK